MGKYDFDRVIDRKNTNCFKWDARPCQEDPELLPLFVADMDFETVPEVKEALTDRIAHGVFGYSIVPDSYYEAVQRWMKRRHDWEIEKEWIVPFPGIVPALKAIVRTFTKPEDEILVFKPVYYPFDFSIQDNGRKLVQFPLTLTEEGRYEIDFEKLEELLEKSEIRMLIMCSPHNPVGRIWSEEELKKLAELAEKYDFMIVSDEIHMDFEYPGSRFIPFEKAVPHIHDRLISATAPSKTFNLAALQTSNLVIPDEKLRDQFVAEMKNAGISDPALLGLIACKTAYEKGEDWLNELIAYLQGNLDFMKNWFSENLPQVRVIEPDGLYLVWADFRALGMDEKELEEFMLKDAHVWLDEGYIFGTGGEGFERFNIACPRSTLEEALNRIGEAWKKREEKTED